MKTYLTLATLVITIAAVPQEIKHAPTLESCVADLNLWTSEIPGWPNSSLDQIRSGTSSLTVREIAARTVSIGECADAYPVLYRSQGDKLSAAVSLIMVVYDTETSQRYRHFVSRHGMSAKFYEEDEAGKR